MGAGSFVQRTEKSGEGGRIGGPQVRRSMGEKRGRGEMGWGGY